MFNLPPKLLIGRTFCDRYIESITLSSSQLIPQQSLPLKILAVNDDKIFAINTPERFNNSSYNERTLHSSTNRKDRNWTVLPTNYTFQRSFRCILHDLEPFKPITQPLVSTHQRHCLNRWGANDSESGCSPWLTSWTNFCAIIGMEPSP